MATFTDDLFQDEDLLKSLEALDEELLQKGEEQTDSGDESDTTGPEGDSATTGPEDDSDSDMSSPVPPMAKGLKGGSVVNRVGGSGAVDHDVPHNAITQKAKKGHADTHGKGNIEHGKGHVAKGGHGGLPVVDAAKELKVPGGKKINHMAKAVDEDDSSSEVESDETETRSGKKHHGFAKSFSDVATPEAEQTLDVTPFLAAQAEAMDSIATTINSLAKSFGDLGNREDLIAKSVVDVGRGLIDTRKQLSEVFESLNDIRKGLRMPVRSAPKSTLAKSEAVERFEANTAPSLSKAQTASILTDLVIKGLVDPMAVSAYEATGWMERSTEQAIQAEITARFGRKA